MGFLRKTHFSAWNSTSTLKPPSVVQKFEPGV
jgi:hypothetical protein